MTDKPEAVSQEKPVYRRTFLDEQFQLHTPGNADAMKPGDIFRRRRVTFVVPRSFCAAEFPEDFELTLAELSAEDEANAAAIGRSGPEIGLLLAKASMHGVNGAPIGEVKRAWFWDALGMNGRTLVVSAFHDHLGMARDKMGKAMVEAIVMGARLE